MAYLMTDVAAGGQAALQLQQSMAAAPNVQQAEANKMQEQQLKLQQEQATLDRTQLNNKVAETGFKVSEDAKAKLKSLYDSPEGKAAMKSEDPSAFFKLANPIIASTGSLEEYAHNQEVIGKLEAQKGVTDLKKHEENRLQMGDAAASIAGASEAEIPNILSKMDEKAKAAIRSHIPGFFEQTDPKVQKAQLGALMNSGLGKNGLAEHQARLELLGLQVKIKEQAVKIEEARLEAVRAKGAGGSGGKEDAKEDRQYKEAYRAKRDIDRDYKKPLQEAEDAWKKATEEDRKNTYGITHWFGGGPSAEEAATPEARKELKSGKAWYALQELKEEILKKKQSTIDDLPEGKEKDRQNASLALELESISKPPPTKAGRDKAAPKEGGTKDVTKNKGGDSAQEAKALTWAKANPNDPRAAKYLKEKAGGEGGTHTPAPTAAPTAPAAAPKPTPADKNPYVDSKGRPTGKAPTEDDTGSPLSKTIAPAVSGAAKSVGGAIKDFTADAQKKFLLSKLADGTATPADKERARRLGLM